MLWMITDFRKKYMKTLTECIYVIPSNFNFTEAEAYINLLQTEGVNKPVDVDADSCTIKLPDWYDSNLFKRCVPIEQISSTFATTYSIFE